MKKEKGIALITLVLIIVAILVIGTVLVISINNNKKQPNNNQSDTKLSELSTEEKENYSSEIQLILDYANQSQYVDINEESAQQLVAFSHKNGIGAITDIDCFGTVEYNENGKTIYAWTIILYGEQDSFRADVSENDGVIYSITYNDKVYYKKDNENIDAKKETNTKKENNDAVNTESNNNSNVDNETTTNKDEFEYVLKNNYSITDDWKQCNIIIDGKTYIIGQTQLKELQNNGWEYNSNFVENQINNGNTATLKPRDESIITIKHEKYGKIITAVVDNNTSVEQKIEDCRLKSIIINLSSLNKESYPDIVIAGNISFNNTLQEVMNKHGKASDLIDKGDGYFSIYWYDTNSAFSYSKSMGILVKETDDGIVSSKILEIAIESK